LDVTFSQLAAPCPLNLKKINARRYFAARRPVPVPFYKITSYAYPPLAAEKTRADPVTDLDIEYPDRNQRTRRTSLLGYKRQNPSGGAYDGARSSPRHRTYFFHVRRSDEWWCTNRKGPGTTMALGPRAGGSSPAASSVEAPLLLLLPRLLLGLEPGPGPGAGRAQ
jgi:hypothetical protein